MARTRRLFCQIAVSKLGYSGAEVARFFGVTTSAVVRAAKTEELEEVQKYL
jgi:predicted transcriptional regulator